MNHMFTDRVKRVMQMAREESARLGHNYIGTEHLLLGIIKEGKGKATTVLINLGLNLEAIKQSVDDYVASSGGQMTMGEEGGLLPFNFSSPQAISGRSPPGGHPAPPAPGPSRRFSGCARAGSSPSTR